MKTEKIDLREVKVFDLMDQQVVLPTQFMKDFGNAVYVNYRDIERQDLGRKIFFSEKELRDLLMDSEEISLFIELFDKMSVLPGLLHNAILEYLNQLIIEIKK